jgi:hypothetical protein
VTASFGVKRNAARPDASRPLPASLALGPMLAVKLPRSS